MNVEEAIKKAIEGGWEDIRLPQPKVQGWTEEDRAMALNIWKMFQWQNNQILFLDPFIWHCLGKGLGRKDKVSY